MIHFRVANPRKPDVRSSREHRSSLDYSIRVVLLLTATIFISRTLVQDAKGRDGTVAVSKGAEQIRQAKDLVTDLSDKWKARYGNLSGECKQSLVEAVQQRGGGKRAILLVKDSLWAGSVCLSADIRSSFYDGALHDLDRLFGQWHSQGFVTATELNKFNKAMLAWKQREQELSTLVVQLIDHTADHAVCYETHASNDPLCEPSSKALEAGQESLGKLAKFSLLDTLSAREGTAGQSARNPSGASSKNESANSVEGAGTITVVAGTYGGNCKQPHGNKTSFLAEVCNGKQSCSYVVDYSRIGDPAVGCPKDYVAEWRCGATSTIHETTAAPEAGYGSVVQLSCIDNGKPPSPTPRPLPRTAQSPPTPEHRPTFSAQVRRLFTGIEKMPSRIWLDAKKPSATPGQPITIQVNVVNIGNIPVPADRDFHVAVRASGGEVTPPEVTISKGDTAAVASVLSFVPGEIPVRASGRGLEGTERSVYYCGLGEIRALDFNGSQQQALANGEKIPFTVVITDGNGHPVTDSKPRSIAFDLQGVGQLQPKDGFVPADQCAKDENALSSYPGETTIKASLGSLSQDRKFLFILPLSFMLFFLILCGGAGGAFIRAAITWSKSRRWSRSRWIAFLTSGALVGLCVFLAYYYGFLRVAPQRIGGKGIGLLLGLTGGYLGQVAMDRIVDRIIPASAER